MNFARRATHSSEATYAASATSVLAVVVVIGFLRGQPINHGTQSQSPFSCRNLSSPFCTISGTVPVSGIEPPHNYRMKVAPYRLGDTGKIREERAQRFNHHATRWWSG